MNQTALFVTYEGIEGAGKSTQLKKVAQFFSNKKVLTTREPGGTVVAEKIRQILIHPTNETLSFKTEAYLMQAARVQHVQEVLEPALKTHDLILCDRFIDSSTAYQGIGRNLGVSWIEQLNAFSIGNAIPNLTFFIDIPLSLSQERMNARLNKKADRFESEHMIFFEKIRAAYLDLCDRYPDRIQKLDGTQSLENLVQTQIQMIQERLA